MTSPSLYEQLFPLTTVMKQRVVENFSGDGLNERWTTRNYTGSNTFQMSDNIGEGFEIVTSGTNGSNGAIDFNNRRQYDPALMTIIAVTQAVSNTLSTVEVGTFSNTVFVVATHFILMGMNTPNDASNFTVRSSNGALSSTSTTVALDTNFHTHSAVMGASDLLYSIDGNLEITKTTNRPTNKSYPHLNVTTQTTAAKTGRIKYLEAYNN